MAEATPHLNAPKQARSKRTLERIVRASLEILNEEGPEGLTVQAIVERAGSSVGSFYARFAGKDELLDYLGERIWHEAAARWDEALAARDWHGLGLEETIEGAVRLLGEAGRSRASVLAALERTPGSREDSVLAFHTHLIRGVERLLLERTRGMSHPDPAVAVPLGLHAVLAVLDASPTPGRETLPLEHRIEEAGRMLRAYLLGGEMQRRPSQDVDFFDVWG